jgi:uncharacterized membrane protein
MITADLPLIVFLVYSLVVLAGICYVLRALLRAADRERKRTAVLQGRKIANAPIEMSVLKRLMSPLKLMNTPKLKTVGIHLLYGFALYAVAAVTLLYLNFMDFIDMPRSDDAFGVAFAIVIIYYLARLFVYTQRKLRRKQEPSIEPPVDPMRVDDSHLNWLDIKRRKFLRRNGEDAADAAIILGGLELAQHRAHIPGTPAPVMPAPMLSKYRDYFGRWELFKVVRFTGRITARLVDEPAGHIVYRKFARKVLNDWQFKEMLDSIDKFAPERGAK